MAKTGRDLLEDKKFDPFIGQLVDRYGNEQTARIWLDAEKRLDGFLATITDLSPLERVHAEGFIYPVCSIFLAIAQDHGRDEAEALCAEFMKRRSQDTGAQLQGMLKSPALRSAFLRVFGFAATRAFGPTAGFEQQIHELGGTRLRMDILDCPYVRHCVAAGAPEVAKLFCANDDYAYGNLPGIAFRRTGTIARGAGRCDFELSLVRDEGDAGDKVDKDVGVEEARDGEADGEKGVTPVANGKLAHTTPAAGPSSTDRRAAISGAYASLGDAASIYDAMMTCGTPLGTALSEMVWLIGKEENAAYLEAAMAGVPEGFDGSLLEVPVGTGVLTMPLYATIPNAQVTCVDYSPDMMSVAQERAERGGLTNVSFRQGDVGELPFEDESFDVVLTLNGIHAFPNKDAAFAELLRVLKPGGTFCGCTYVSGEVALTDWWIRNVHERRGFFTPPYDTAASLEARLQTSYSKVHVETHRAIACFTCVK